MQSIECIVHKSNIKTLPLEDIEIDKKVENYRLELLAVLKGDNIISLTSAKRRKERTIYLIRGKLKNETN